MKVFKKTRKKKKKGQQNPPKLLKKQGGGRDDTWRTEILQTVWTKGTLKLEIVVHIICFT